MQTKANAILSLILFFCFSSAANSGQIYKWVDENGKVHFGDRPNSNQSQQEVELKPLNTVGSGDSSRKTTQQKMLNSFQKRREEEAKNKQQQRQLRIANQQKCRMSKARLANIENASGVYTMGSDGKRKYYDSNKRENIVAKKKRDISRYCR